MRYPDLLIAFDVDPEAYRLSNAYVISEQGKPPDFVLEIASSKTGKVDTGDKRREYAGLGIPEYWRFDETGEFHGIAAGRRPSGVRRIPPHSPSNNCPAAYCKATATGAGPASALGRAGNCAGTTRPPGGISQRLRVNATGPSWRAKPASERRMMPAVEREAPASGAEDDARVEREARLLEREARLQAEARARELEERLESPGNQ